MSTNVGRQIEFIRDRPLEPDKADQYGKRITGYVVVRKGTKGRVISENLVDHVVTIHYDVGNGVYGVFNHSLNYEGRSWRFINPPSNSTLTIQEERSYALYVASSSEDIKGFVPQVRYREEIVWQGDPVATTSDSGEDLSKDEQAKAALKAAEAKIQEVVKKQFA